MLARSKVIRTRGSMPRSWSTLVSSLGCAARIIVACASEASVCTATTSRSSRRNPGPSRLIVEIGWRSSPSNLTGPPPASSFRGADRQSDNLYSTRSTCPNLTDNTARRSGSSALRSLPRGHHAPSTKPILGAFGFNRNLGVRDGICIRCEFSAACSVIWTLPSMVEPTDLLNRCSKPKWAIYTTEHQHG